MINSTRVYLCDFRNMEHWSQMFLPINTVSHDFFFFLAAMLQENSTNISITWNLNFSVQLYFFFFFYSRHLTCYSRTSTGVSNESLIGDRGSSDWVRISYTTNRWGWKSYCGKAELKPIPTHSSWQGRRDSCQFSLFFVAFWVLP